VERQGEVRFEQVGDAQHLWTSCQASLRDQVSDAVWRSTFQDIVELGPSNQFAHAAALSVAGQPGRSYNPLFIYGDAGLGKTHLLQAIGHYVRENYRDYVVRYVTSETFLNEFIESIR
jgi:chromosomal replication initiator protein